MGCTQPRSPTEDVSATDLRVARQIVAAELLLVPEALAEEPDAEPDVVGVLHLLPEELVFAQPRQLQALITLGGRGGGKDGLGAGGLGAVGSGAPPALIPSSRRVWSPSRTDPEQPTCR